MKRKTGEAVFQRLKVTYLLALWLSKLKRRRYQMEEG